MMNKQNTPTIHRRTRQVSAWQISARRAQILLAAVVVAMVASHVCAADVQANLSAREAYVGTAVTLEVSVVNASDYEEPEPPSIDGCDVRSAGAPSQRSSISIINGRRSESRSVTFRYQVIPRRAGTFNIPPMELQVDGKTVTTRPLRFVATKSENGDVLFVEIEGKKSKVFVGQPLDLKLKVWIKPYRDRKNNLKLSEGDMWQLLSEQTEWGMFSERMKELAENNQRPGGEEVLRDDGQGGQRSYYLYEIDATIYPTKPGKIAGDDVQVIVNYPTEISKARDPFDSFFGRDPFDRGSILSQMMDDDFFSSPFRNRLQVSRYRPIVASAQVDETEIVPVPVDGRPADYRGAVGKYNIVTQATPTSVSAGDPITLNIGIAGTGPMELVQAPPLAELSDLTADFKVADRSLAGFVQDDTKLFSTTIRPLRQGTTQIPPIPFSFFDPDAEKFVTVMSQPIEITVDKSESLSLDSIVAGTDSNGSEEQKSSAVPLFKPSIPDFTNRVGNSLLISQSARSHLPWWLLFVVLPPVVWGVLTVGRVGHAIMIRLPSIRSAYATCMNQIAKAKDHDSLVDALTRYIERRVHRTCDQPVHAVGALRSLGAYAVAGEAEAFFQHCENVRFSGDEGDSLAECKAAAKDLTVDLEATLKSIRKSRVRRPGKPARRSRGKKAVAGAAILLAIGFGGLPASIARADELNANTIVDQAANLDLTSSQREAILQEATELYQQAMTLHDDQPSDAKELFRRSAEKYQMLVDTGIKNAGLYFNLGNAYLQADHLGRAIANYQRSQLLDPNNRQLAANLAFATKQVTSARPSTASADGSVSVRAIGDRLARANETFLQNVGLAPIIWMLILSSLAFWGILIARAVGIRFRHWRWALPCLLLLALSAASYAQASSTTIVDQSTAVIVSQSVSIHSGDGEQFPVTAELDKAEGRQVKIITRRGDWVQIETEQGAPGWIPSRHVEQLVP